MMNESSLIELDSSNVIAPEPISPSGGSHFAQDASEGSGKRNKKKSKKRRKKRHDHTVLILLVVVVIIVGVLYGGGAYVFSNVCYPGTEIAGVDVSLMDRETAVSRIDAALTNYQLTISGVDFEWTYEPESSDEIFDAETAFDDVVDGNEPLKWPVRLYEALTGTQVAEAAVSASDDIASEETADETATTDESSAAEESASTDETATTVETVDDNETTSTDEDGTISLEAYGLPSTFDVEAFQASLSEAVATYNEGKSGTFDMESAYDESSGSYTVEAALENRVLDEDAVLDAALEAVSTLSRSVEIDESYLEPLAEGLDEETMQTACDAANALVGASSELTMGGTVVATLDDEQLLEWVSFSDAGLVVDEDAITAWVGELADELDTVGCERTYTRPDGETITISGGTFGWLSDEAALVETIENAITSGEVTDIEVPTKQEGDVYTGYGEVDWGAYVDVDISEQYARYYDADGNIIWEAGIISGNPNKGNDTPQGVYYVVSKGTDITLVGDTYETPVSYWMAFVGGSVGFHDATWQDESNFGNPEAYLSVGSHGCVNLSYSSAEALYEVLEVGTCVIVHD